jgi:hypothetical protein
MALIEFHCAECAEVTAFEQPPCVDGHGVDCPEWACTRCGDALLIGAAPRIARPTLPTRTLTHPITRDRTLQAA